MNHEKFQHWLLSSPEKNNPEGINQWMLQGLALGLEALNLETGIISRINNRDYVIQQVSSTLGDIFHTGDQFELNNTYCEAVARQHKTITYIQVGAIPEMRLHPVYQAVQLESYIGSPIPGKDGDVTGTVNFSSHEAREVEFTQEEVLFVEQMAHKLAEVLAH